MNKQYYDVIVLGGGPAGMNAALVLGRSRLEVLVLNAETPRNLVTTHSHGFLTQDGKHPSEILSIAKKQLKKYPLVDYRVDRAIDLVQLEIGFKVITESNEYLSRRVIVATGYKDNIDKLGIQGLREVYGKSVFPCPFCDGFEMSDRKLAVFGDANVGPMFAKIISNWSDDVVVVTNGEQIKDEQVLESLRRNKVSLIDKPIKDLVSKNGLLEKIVFEDGASVSRDGGFIADTRATESVDFLNKLKLPTSSGFIGMKSYKVDENKESPIKGLYIVGDARTGWSGVVSAAAEGSDVAASITHQIVAEKWIN
ncbi:NAD(P)/FAD-dependent oxidoreductase [Pseudobacteriovorax antillogorgiicola]|uniref:Thioredoxin reductase n=1 Tax=Pseudobacteriovorax antillogorgiicola TaxID=1513793 RepID=A0A1Y6CGT2_9BACT|nr:NAD(P)/FAD-dependent oxidoreductase [Pseudobacteriovorax antillogorgiicola]TCS46950.1 thioredoxin reductase [Pseudobacteriovorax antillogorgiicola]SMF64506.1 Thioredoxin reductase [Pseudobacteriovorax antillogorgiicola]